jgi:hypothetical protein
MLRTALLIASFTGLLTSTALASSTEHASTYTWRPRGFRKHRAAQGDYVPVYASYRNRTQYGFFGFLHHSPGARHYGAKTKHTKPHAGPAHKHGLSIF